MTRPATSRAGLALWFLLTTGGVRAEAPAAGGTEPAALRVQAETLYIEGRFAEALPLLEQLDAAGTATGPLLYRLTYCQRKTGQAEQSVATERRALETLERELAASGDLEVPFYLSNIYRNVGRVADANRVASETTQRFEQGQLAQPRTGLEQFQIGKLYADQGRAEPATEWYTQAVDALLRGGPQGGPYVGWASRYLAERAHERKDHYAVQRYYGVLADTGEATGPELERLAVARMRIGMYAEAEQAWKLVKASHPADPSRAQYAARLCRLATTLSSQSTQAPSGKPWNELTQQELESLMRESVAQIQELLADGEMAPGQAERREIRARIKQAKETFVPAAIEYTLRGHDIRATAFFGGFAPLILNRKAWRSKWTDTDAGEAGAE